jgi:hypothetical protein
MSFRFAIQHRLPGPAAADGVGGRVAPGKLAEVNFGRLGLVSDREAGRRRVPHALVVTLVLPEWQRRNGYIPFQLPEPFSGRRSRTGLVFMGLNPGVTHHEMIPRYGEVDFADYHAYFRRRFDDRNRDESGRLVVRLKPEGSKAPRLWSNLERFGSEYLSELAPEGFRLGDDAVLLQAIRYKSTAGWLGDSVIERRRTLEHQRTFTESLIDEGAIRILVPMRSDVARSQERLGRADPGSGGRRELSLEDRCRERS